MSRKISLPTLRKNSYPGLFIALEGLDGSGKTTQLTELETHFRKQGKEVYSFHWMRKEGSLFTDVIQGYLSGSLSLPKAAMQYVFSADYVIFSEEVIIPALKAGKVVISDRCHFWSAVAYGTWENGGKFDPEIARSLLVTHGVTTAAYQFIIPDQTFYLSLSVDTAMERLQNKKGKDIYEKRNVLESVKEGYDWLLNEFPETFVQIDAENAKKQVTTEILTALQPSS